MKPWIFNLNSLLSLFFPSREREKYSILKSSGFFLILASRFSTGAYSVLVNYDLDSGYSYCGGSRRNISLFFIEKLRAHEQSRALFVYLRSTQIYKLWQWVSTRSICPLLFFTGDRNAREIIVHLKFMFIFWNVFRSIDFDL